MSSFVWMKVLESAPERYDRGIDMLSRGRIGDIHARIATLAAAPGRRLVDIGCGTGGVTLACAAKGAIATGIDRDAGMLEVARGKRVAGPGSAEFVELAAAEIEDRFAPESLDAAVSCLAFSEMSEAEQDYVLGVALSRLVPGGRLVIADEVRPRARLRRLVLGAARLPLAVAAYALTQTTTRPLRDLAARIEAAGFVDVTEERLPGGSFCLVSARKEAA